MTGALLHSDVRAFTDCDTPLAWLVFSGEKHADHGVDELVALVYSNGNVAEMYHSLEGGPSPL